MDGPLEKRPEQKSNNNKYVVKMLSKLKEIPRHQRICQEILTLNNIFY